MDGLFLFGVALMPFENFFFAPSDGWAALSPLVFFVYAVLQRDSLGISFKRFFPIFIIFLLCVTISSFDYLLFNTLYPGNMIDTLGTAVLGLTCLYSFDIYINIKQGSISRLTKIMLGAYSVALAIGVVQFVAVRFGISPLQNLFELIMKRSYFPRVQFMFTEPSFTTMHLFGVLLPFYLVTRNRKILWLMAGFIGVVLLSSSSLRLLADSIVVLVLIAINYADWTKARTYIYALITPIVLIAAVLIGMQASPRFASFIQNGFDSDPSYASRMFRIEASITGLLEEPIGLLTGYGAGNAWVPMKIGYDEALAHYDNAYTYEVLALGETDNRPTSIFCLYLRFAGEYGIVLMAAVVVCFITLNRKVANKDWRLLLIVCAYLYFQFDGYAFYAIWIVLSLCDCFGSKNGAVRWSPSRSDSLC